MKINRNNFPLYLIYGILFFLKVINFIPDVSWTLLLAPFLGYVIYFFISGSGMMLSAIGPIPILVILGLYYLFH